MGPKSDTKSLLIGLLVLNGVFLAVWVFLFLGTKAKNENASSIINTIEQKSRDQQLDSSIQKILAETNSQRDEISSYKIGKDSVVQFLQSIEDMGSSTQTRVHVNTVNQVENPDPGKGTLPPTLHLTISVDGSWSGVFAVLKALENLPNSSNINTVTLTHKDNIAAPEKGSAQATWQGNFDLFVLGSAQ